MANRRVRIYNGPDPEKSNLIGFSLSAADAPDKPAFAKFMTDRGYAWQQVETRLEDGVSFRYVQVRPPLSREHTHELARLCVGGFVNGELVEPIINSSNNDTLVYDNRHIPVESPMGGGELILKG